MHRTGRYWNQACDDTDTCVVAVLRVLAAPECTSRLRYLAKRLAALKVSDARPRTIKSQRQRARRPGWVVDAVARVMAGQGEPMRVAQVHAAVEALLGEAVSKDSVSWCLSAGARRRSGCSSGLHGGGMCWRSAMGGTWTAQVQRAASSAVRHTVLDCVLRASPDKRPRRAGGGVRRRLQAAPGRTASLAARPHRRHPGYRRSPRLPGLGPHPEPRAVLSPAHRAWSLVAGRRRLPSRSRVSCDRR